MSDIEKNNSTLLVGDKMAEVDKYELTVNQKQKATTDFNALIEDFKNRHANQKGGKFYSEYTVFDEFGRVRGNGHNELIISGGLFVLEKISGVGAPFKTKSLNEVLNMNLQENNNDFIEPYPDTDLPTPSLRREDVIAGFVIGTGGSGELFDSVKEVYYKETEVEDMIPFRMVETDNDLDATTKAYYYLRTEKNGYASYYMKRPESIPLIKVEKDTAGFPTVTLANLDSIQPNEVINTYLQYTLKINCQDIREYNKISVRNLKKARVNSLMLVHGYKDNSIDEYRGVRGFSKINFNNEPFDNETKELTVVYKIYI